MRADPKFFALGKKSGCRKIFQEESVPHPLGHENLASKDEVIEAIKHAGEKAFDQTVLVSLMKVFPARQCPGRFKRASTVGDSKERTALGDRLRAMQFELKGTTYDSYMKELQDRRELSKSELRERSSEAQACSFASLRWAWSNCSPPMIKCWAVHQGKVTWDASSRPTAAMLR